MSKYAQHQNLLKKFLIEFQQAFPQMRFFERHVGLFYTKYGKPVRINKAGMFDVWAIAKTKNGTIHFEFEIKSGSAYKSKEQKDWGEFLDFMGVPHFEVRETNLPEIKKALDKLLSKA